MAASAAVANVLLLKKRADARQRAALRIKFEVKHNLLRILINHFLYFLPFLKDSLTWLPSKLTATVTAG